MQGIRATSTRRFRSHRRAVQIKEVGQTISKHGTGSTSCTVLGDGRQVIDRVVRVL